MNPDGFFENYLFMDWSLQVFMDLDSWGHVPPTLQSVKSYNKKIDQDKFAYNSLVSIHDDRISNLEKLGFTKTRTGLLNFFSFPTKAEKRSFNEV